MEEPYYVSIQFGMAPWVIMWIGIVLLFLIYHMNKR